MLSPGIKKIINILKADEDSPENIARQYSIIKVVSLVMACTTLITSAMNILQQRYIMFFTTLTLMFVFIGAYLVCRKQRCLALSKLSIVGAVGTIFTFYAVTGGNEGFAILWALVSPGAIMFAVGLGYGLLLSLYFQILLVLLFWTPLSVHVQGLYAEFFMLRFPILHLGIVVFGVISAFSIKAMRVRQDEHNFLLQLAVAEEHKKVAQMTMQTITSICRAVDAKDAYTHQHSERVAEYACMMAGTLGWGSGRIENLRAIARLHDIGKIGVDDAVLQNPGSLNAEEYAAMQEHPVIGGNILQELDLIENVRQAVACHHEHYNGKGYPYGLKGDEIPQESRIIAIADAFDAMNSNRVYRGKRDRDYIINELKKGCGKQFDPELTAVFLELLYHNSIEF